MTTTADPRGRQAELYVGTQPDMLSRAAFPPVQFVRRHFYDFTPSPQSEPQDDAILGGGFANDIDDRQAAPDMERGSVRVAWPLDMVQIGFVLNELLGAAATTGASAPYSHTFTSSPQQVPIRSFERRFHPLAHDGVVGAVCRSVQFPIGPDRGYTRVNADYFAREVLEQYEFTLAGVPTVLPLSARVPRAIGTIKKDGVTLGSILSGDLTITNMLGEDSYHGSRLIDDVQLEGRSSALNLTARFKGSAMRDFGKIPAGQYLPGVMDIELSWELSATSKLTITVRNQRFAKVGIGTGGPGRLDVALRSRGEVGLTDPMITAVLVNSMAVYG